MSTSLWSLTGMNCWASIPGGCRNECRCAVRRRLVAYESLAGDPLYGQSFDQSYFTPDLPQPPNRLALTSLVAPPEGGPGDAASIVFGASLSMRGGLRTEFREV